MSEQVKPRLLLIERETATEPSARRRLSEVFEIVTARSMARAAVLLRELDFVGVYVDSAHLSAMRSAGVLLQIDEILDAIADGAAVVEPDLKVIWANPEFHLLAGSGSSLIGEDFYKTLRDPEILDSDPCPFQTAISSRQTASSVIKLDGSRYFRLTVTPVADAAGILTHLVALTRDITEETHQQQKLDAIHRAGEELADLTPEELVEMRVEERTDLLKYNIGRHMKDLLGLDYTEIRLLERESGRLIPLLTVGMTPTAATRELFAEVEGNGVTGFVAATGQSYLCADTTSDPHYLEGAAGARSSLTVPIIDHGKVIGTLNVENPSPNAFKERDRQFLEMYAHSVAVALNTLQLLQAEQRTTATASVEAIGRELALPLDEILSDATTALDRYAGHDEEIITRLRHLIFRAREIRGLIRKVGSKLTDEGKLDASKTPLRLAGQTLLVVDADETVRRAAHQLLGKNGAVVETARDAHEAMALARVSTYSCALIDIRLPDMNGYEAFCKLREIQHDVPIILMTGFGYDPSHSIVKARQDGLQSVLYKPFRVDRLIETVEQAVRPPAEGSADSTRRIAKSEHDHF